MKTFKILFYLSIALALFFVTISGCKMPMTNDQIREIVTIYLDGVFDTLDQEESEIMALKWYSENKIHTLNRQFLNGNGYPFDTAYVKSLLTSIPIDSAFRQFVIKENNNPFGTVLKLNGNRDDWQMRGTDKTLQFVAPIDGKIMFLDHNENPKAIFDVETSLWSYPNP